MHSQPTPAGSRAERYLAHLDRLAPDREPGFTQIESSNPAMKGVTAIAYRDLPEAGFITAVTYGLSLAEHPDWRHGKPELLISVFSRDERWAVAAAVIAERLRGSAAFSYGETIDFGEPVGADSSMSAFVVFAPTVLDREDFTGIDVGDSLPINLQGLYPIHDDERRWIQRHGLEEFWQLAWDPYDVGRAPVVG
jgi:Suppressor of fused protein (SUFU)